MNSRSKLKITKRSYILTFGKHKGQSINTVLDTDPGYILWMDSEGVAEFSRDILDEAVESDDPWPLDLDNDRFWGIDIND